MWPSLSVVNIITAGRKVSQRFCAPEIDRSFAVKSMIEFEKKHSISGRM
jgi:hypothetical protein